MFVTGKQISDYNLMLINDFCCEEIEMKHTTTMKPASKILC